MNRFTYADELISAVRLAVALALVAAGGCVTAPEPGFDRGIDLEAFDAGGRAPQFRCPVRHVYVCERRLRTEAGNCYCAPEPSTPPSAPGALRGVF